MKTGLQHISPAYLVAVRFTAAFAVFLFVWLIFRKRPADIRGLLNGSGLGILMFISYILQTEGLRYTTASRSAFLTQMLILFTPLIEFVIFRKIPDRLTGISVFTVIAGLLIFSGAESGSLNTGDQLTLLCAAAFGLYIVLLDHVSVKSGIQELLISQTGVTAFLGWLWFAAAGEKTDFSIFQSHYSLFFSLIYLSVFATNGAVWIQTRWQNQAGSVRASVIYTLEPVFGALLAFLFIQESLSVRELSGAAVMVTGFLIRPVYLLYKNKILQ